MNASETLPANYDALQRRLTDAGSEASAAEVHGIICGLLCSPASPPPDWPRLLHPHPTPPPIPAEVIAALQQLYEQTAVTLSGAGFEFEPLLPDDRYAMPLRVQSLGEWCEGFLLGLSLGGADDRASLPDDVREFVDDVAHIAQVEAEDVAGEEAEERAVADLTEYLRAGVQLTYEELRRGGSADPEP